MALLLLSIHGEYASQHSSIPLSTQSSPAQAIVSAPKQPSTDVPPIEHAHAGRQIGGKRDQYGRSGGDIGAAVFGRQRRHAARQRSDDRHGSARHAQAKEERHPGVGLFCVDARVDGVASQAAAGHRQHRRRGRSQHGCRQGERSQ